MFSTPVKTSNPYLRPPTFSAALLATHVVSQHAVCPISPPPLSLLLFTYPPPSRRSQLSAPTLRRSSPFSCPVHNSLTFHRQLSPTRPSFAPCLILPPTTLVICVPGHCPSCSPAITRSSPSHYTVHELSSCISGYSSPLRVRCLFLFTPTHPVAGRPPALSVTYTFISRRSPHSVIAATLPQMHALCSPAA